MRLVTELLQRTERRRVAASLGLEADSQARLGQYFTPSRAADLIVSMIRLPPNGVLRVLDPGAGIGSLTAALTARVLLEAPALHLHLVAVELDETIAATLRLTLDDCVATAAAMGVKVTAELVVGDYIDVGVELGDFFDVVIMNPPYGKIAAHSHNRKTMASRGVQTPNLYAAFLAIGVAGLESGGQLVSITPRSFANGTYFGQFRGFFLDRLAIDRIHIFESRSTVFSDTGVLQENVIIAGTRDGKRGDVTLSVSTGHEDEVSARRLPYAEVVRPTDLHRFIRIPSADGSDAAVEFVRGLPCSLVELGVSVSTGRVVDFRSRENLVEFGLGQEYPMVYPSNMKRGVVLHPRAGGKPQGFRFARASDSKMLVPPGTYVLVKRFSAKEERRRIVAGVWSAERNGEIPVAFDNKLNYIHTFGQGLDPDLASGLSLWLNSTVVDTCFRTFSGHTQVNATDLRSMRYPSASALRELGRGRTPELPEQSDIDRLVSEVLHVEAVA